MFVCQHDTLISSALHSWPVAQNHDFTAKVSTHSAKLQICSFDVSSKQACHSLGSCGCSFL